MRLIPVVLPFLINGILSCIVQYACRSKRAATLTDLIFVTPRHHALLLPKPYAYILWVPKEVLQRAFRGSQTYATPALIGSSTLD